ncbi:hypothetical protein LCGC14_1927090 [marine sediment metagenome]|uniref:DUF6378 domain-containing protein n=1 Tax=marine sediment metagenome TaxID=412755 RepID=A0A0F9GCD5_9ZZZZ
MRDIVSDILNECIEVHEERNKQYGGSYSNFTDIACIATMMSVQDKIFTPVDVAVCMIATKEARYKYALNHPDMKNRDKVIHDSLIDWINYTAILENVRILTDKDAQNEVGKPQG